MTAVWPQVFWATFSGCVLTERRGRISRLLHLRALLPGVEDPQLAAAACVSWRRRKRNKLRPSLNKPTRKRHVYGPPAQWHAALQSDFTSLRSVCAPTCRSLICLSDTSASLSRSAPLLLSLRLTKCCGASTAGRLRVCYITAAPASLNRCRARASLSLATYLASASLFKARQLRFFYVCTLRIHGVFAFFYFPLTNGSPRAAATQKPSPPVSVTLLQTRSPSGGALRDYFVSPDHYLYTSADDVITQISTKKDGTLYHRGRPGLHF